MQRLANQNEDWLHKFRPHMASIGRFLLVATFIEDTFRILAQWSDQLLYMQAIRNFPWIISVSILATLTLMMATGVSLVLLSERHRSLGAFVLVFVIAEQAMAYGLLLDASFLLKSGSLMGGLVLLVAQTSSANSKKKSVFGGLPVGLEAASRLYLPLLGRVLLILLCISLFLGGSEMLSFERHSNVIKSISGLAAIVGGIMVAVGFQAKTSAALLIAVLLLTNMFIIHDWVSLGFSHPQADFLKYDFFQSLSIMGGFLLLIQHGPGEFSVDLKNKHYYD